MAGYMCYYGDGIKKDLERGLKYYQKAADLGSLDAINELNKLK